MIPTKEQVKQIKYSCIEIGMYVSKKNIARIIKKWEEIRRVNI